MKTKTLAECFVFTVRLALAISQWCEVIVNTKKTPQIMCVYIYIYIHTHTHTHTLYTKYMYIKYIRMLILEKYH